MSEKGEPIKGENIWVMDRTAAGWSEPTPLPPAINSLSKHWQISVDREGDLYFGVWKVDPVSRRTREHDIYCSRNRNGQYGTPETLGPEINAPDSRQYSPYVVPDGSYLVFTRVENTEPPVVPVITVHPNNSIRAGFGTGRKVAGGNWDSRISQNVLESNLHEARN